MGPTYLQRQRYEDEEEKLLFDVVGDLTNEMRYKVSTGYIPWCYTLEAR